MDPVVPASAEKNSLAVRLAVIGAALLAVVALSLLVAPVRAWILADPVGSVVLAILVGVLLLVEFPLGVWMFRRPRAPR